MNRNQIEKLLEAINEIIERLESGENSDAYSIMVSSASSIQAFLIFLLDNDVLEQELVVMIMTDIVNAMEHKDDVLILDTLKYGLRNLLRDIVKIMEEDDE